MPVHPKIDDETGLAYGHWEPGWKPVVGYEEFYEVNHMSQVRNKNTGKILKPKSDHSLCLYDDKRKKYYKFTYHLVLESFFPHIPRNNRTCDHINENHDHQHIDNLWWLTSKQQMIKSHKLKPRKNHIARSKKVEQWSWGHPNIKINTFASTNEAEKQTGVHQGSISNCARGCRPTAGGYQWKFEDDQSQKDLLGEEWRTNEALVAALKARNPKMTLKNIVKVRVSNFGRIQTTTGIKTKGKKESKPSCYRTYANWLVHQLVWIVFGDGRLPPKKSDKLVIMHNDEAEKDEEGYVSNAISNLKIGTESENMLSFFRAKAKKRLLSEISDESESNKKARI